MLFWTVMTYSWTEALLYSVFRGDKCLKGRAWVTKKQDCFILSFVFTQTALKIWIQMTFSAVSGHFFDEEFQLCSDVCLPSPVVCHQSNNPYRTVIRSALFVICINDSVTLFHNSEKDSFQIHFSLTCDRLVSRWASNEKKKLLRLPY